MESKNLHSNAKIHLDYIPSKQAIKLAYAELTGDDSLDCIITKSIEQKTTTLAI